MNNSMTKKARKFRSLVVLAIVTILTLGVFLFRGNQVILNVDGNSFEVVSNAKTVEELIKEEDVIKENAYIDLDLETEIEKGLEIEVKNPKTYTIDVQGMITEVTSVHTEVEKILEDFGVELNEHDYTHPRLNENVPAGTNIEYFHVEVVEDVEETAIAFEEQQVENADLEKGKIRNAQEGKEGLRRKEIQRRYVNGTLVENTIKSDEVVEEAVAHIDEIGTKEPQAVVAQAKSKPAAQQSQAAPQQSQSASSQPSRASARNVITMNASAYDLSFESTGKRPGDPGYGITASGTKVRPGVVSVDPSVIPLGTRLYIESLDGSADYGHAVAEDTGGAIKGNKIDLFFGSRNAALSFGRRNVKVHILD